jgi:hypothetical protein
MSPKTNELTANFAFEGVSALLRSALSDPGLKTQIINLARLPSLHRAAILKTAIHEMTLRGEPEDIRSAFGLLATDEGAAVALQFLSPDQKKA